MNRLFQHHMGFICHLLAFLVIGSLYIILTVASAVAGQIAPVDVGVHQQNLSVSTSITLDPRFVEELQKGLSKELFVYIDLFRVWKIWPDEFISGKKIVKLLKSDPIKREHVGSSNDGAVHIEKRFKDLDAMLLWALTISDEKLPIAKVLEPGAYYVKVTVEAHARKLPPIIGYLLFFIPEHEFRVSRDSSIMQMGGAVP